MFEKFIKKSEKQIEDLYESKIIEENEAEDEKEVNSVKFVVIKYEYTDEDAPVPSMDVICKLHTDVMPMIDSIIWAPSTQRNCLLPYKVIRYDYIEDPDSDAYKYTYIVVKDALNTDIIK